MGAGLRFKPSHILLRFKKWMGQWRERRKRWESQMKRLREEGLLNRWPNEEEMWSREWEHMKVPSLDGETRREGEGWKERWAALEEEADPFEAVLSFNYFFYKEIYFPKVAEELAAYGVGENYLYDTLMAWVKEVGFSAYEALRGLWHVYTCCSQYSSHTYRLYAYALFHLTKAIEGRITHGELRNLLENVDRTFHLPHIPLPNPNADCICGDREEDRVDEARALATLEKLVEVYQRKHHMSLLISEGIRKEKSTQGDL